MKSKKKPISVHHGMPGHFIGAPDCCFHMHTTVRGKFRVSTVGCYHQEGEEPREIGCGRKFETMVFRLKGGKLVDYSEIDFAPYNDEASADAGHAAMVERYARLRANAVIR